MGDTVVTTLEKTICHTGHGIIGERLQRWSSWRGIHLGGAENL